VQADRWHITQDGESKPIIFDGVVARRALDDEVIVGKIMAYGIGRLIVTRGRDVYFGDLFGSHEGDPSDSVLKFTETNFLSEGFPAEIPYTQGEITAVSFFPAQDTATGQGVGRLYRPWSGQLRSAPATGPMENSIQQIAS
jgi:hypothetical protein